MGGKSAAPPALPAPPPPPPTYGDPGVQAASAALRRSNRFRTGLGGTIIAGKQKFETPLTAKPTLIGR